LPVSVVVGRAQVVSATLRGQAFDLKPHTQVTVARFEVKE
jgi:cytoskeleton protein RodZ